MFMPIPQPLNNTPPTSRTRFGTTKMECRNLRLTHSKMTVSSQTEEKPAYHARPSSVHAASSRVPEFALLEVVDVAVPSCCCCWSSSGAGGGNMAAICDFDEDICNFSLIF